jgi:hypothetical protein
MSSLGLGAASIALAGVMVLTSSSKAASISGAQDGWAAITACAHTNDDEARRDCMDGVLRRAGLLTLTPGDAVATSRDAAPIRRLAAPPSPAPQQDRPKVLGVTLPGGGSSGGETFTVAKAQMESDGRVRFVTSGGEAWRSQDAGLELPKAGQSITIRDTVLGGYECRAGKWEVFLCSRDGSARQN